MIWIIGGTNESSEISRVFPYHKEITYTVATSESQEFLSSDNIFIGKKDTGEMVSFAQKYEIEAIFDLSHPFADIVTQNAKITANEVGIPYFRYVREENNRYDQCVYVSSYEDAYEYISKLKGVFLFTTGSKNVAEFQKVRGNNRFIFRVLPSVNSLKDLKDANVEMKDSLGMLGPFSLEMNRLLLREYKVDYLVTKESGKSSGVDQKIQACILEGVTPIVISRKSENGISSFEKLIESIEEYI